MNKNIRIIENRMEIETVEQGGLQTFGIKIALAEYRMTDNSIS